MDAANAHQLKAELRQFTGTEQYYYLPMFRDFRYTDGVKYLAERAGAYWLLEYVFSNQEFRNLSEAPFQVWKLRINADCSALMIIEDGNDNELRRFEIPFTDFPIKEFDLWLVDKVLILPSEY